MIYKVLYQKDKVVNPRRETTQTLYIDATRLWRHVAWWKKTPHTTSNTCKNCQANSWNSNKKNLTSS